MTTGNPPLVPKLPQKIPEMYQRTPTLYNWYRLGKLFVGYNANNKRVVTEVIHRISKFSNGILIEGQHSVYVLWDAKRHPTKRDQEL